MNVVTHAQLALKLVIYFKYIYTARASIQVFSMGQEMSGPDSANGKGIQHESEDWGFDSLSGRDIFCLKNFDTFTRISVWESRMNAVARAQLTFQMLTLLHTNMSKKFLLFYTIMDCVNLVIPGKRYIIPKSTKPASPSISWWQTSTCWGNSYWILHHGINEK